MDPKTLNSSEFVWQRLLDDTPAWAVAAPVAFALAVIILVAVFQRKNFGVKLYLILAVIGSVVGKFLPIEAGIALAVVLNAILLVALYRHKPFSGKLITGMVVSAILSVVYVPLALLFRPIFSWMVVLVPMLAIALFYVGMMYLKDARTIHPLWAAFLGLLRTSVYGILAVVFLLPSCQTFDESTNHPKVVFLFDVSGSMNTIDDTPEPGQDPASLKSRQDKVIQFLTTAHQAGADPAPATFLDRLAKSTAWDAYRFGPILDEKEVQRVKQGKTLATEQFAHWLKPRKADVQVPEGTPEDKKALKRQEMEDLIDLLQSGTNIGGAALSAAKLENNSFLQAIVIISDGNSNVGGDEAMQEFITRVNNARRTIPVYTVGVGEFRQPASIRIEDILAPEVVRPDDKFPIRVPVLGTGLADEVFQVTLEMTRTENANGEPVPPEKTFILGPKAGKFHGVGDNPQDTVEFEIDVQDLLKIKAADDKAGLLEGTWEFVAKVPRSPREAFSKPEHVTDPVKVKIQKKELRILLFAGGATREYQFLRTVFYRETQQKRVQLSILLQDEIGVAHVDQDVDKEHMLVRFPDRRGEPKPGEKQYSLSEYDAIVAVDPDWSLLTKEQLRLLKEWVDKDAGGIVFVAGPVNTYQLARPGGMDLSSLLTLYPVMPKDSRLHGLNLGGDLTHDASRSYVLHFTPAAKDYEFLKLDEKGETPTAGWDAFFWAGSTPEPGKNPRRGFHNYYPVAKLKPDSSVIATFGGPKSSYFEDSDGKFKEQPYLVSMRYGAGKTVYLGSGETWRLRPKEGYHERFWIKLARYVAAGSSLQKKYGNIYLPRTAAVGTISFEAKLRDERQEPLPSDSHPVVFVRKITDNPKDAEKDKAELKPRPVDDPREWQGYFSGTVKVRSEGKYEFKIPIPGTAESIKQEVMVRKPNPETDNVRNDFDYLYKIASEATKVLKDLPPEVRKEVQGKLKAPSADPKDVPRLFFTLQTADAITKCLRPIEPKREKIKGPLIRLWDQGVGSGLSINAYHLAWGAPFALGIIGFGILLFLRQALYAGLFLAGAWLVALLAAVSGMFTGEWPDLPIDFSFVLISVVVLLSIEWLTRKLLKLA